MQLARLRTPLAGSTLALAPRRQPAQPQVAPRRLPPPPMTTPPTVSVLMAVYNGEKYLRDAVDSVLTQTFHQFEFVIIDDGSTDNSLEILNEYAALDPRIRLVSRPNKGLTRTLNEGMTLCSCELIARMDSDDVCMPQRLEKQVAFLNQHPDVVLVGAQVEFIDPEGCQINLKPGVFLTHEEIDAALLRKGWPVVHPAVMMRRSTVLAAGGYAEKWLTNQDHDLFLRLAEKGKVVNLPDVLLQYRQHFQSISLMKSQQQGDTVAAILHEAYARRGLTMPAELLNARPRPKTKLDYHRSWCWAALAGGHIKTARKHALAALRQQPFEPESWKMVYCSIRGR